MAEPSSPKNDVPIMQLVMIAAGTIIVLATLAAWLYAAKNGIESSPLWAFSIPIAGALLIGHQLSRVGENAKQAAVQTNGNMEARMKAAAAQALAERDAARTRQAQGDISSDVVMSTPHGNLP